MLRKTRLLLLLIALLFVVSLLALDKPLDCGNGRLKFGNRCLSLEYADTPAKRMQGLSGRGSIEEDRGMIFAFEGSGQRCFWMKEMKFSIDILWLNEQGEILKIKENVSPDTYPNQFCASGTKNVLEVRSGLTKKAGLNAYDRLKL